MCENFEKLDQCLDEITAVLAESHVSLERHGELVDELEKTVIKYQPLIEELKTAKPALTLESYARYIAQEFFNEDTIEVLDQLEQSLKNIDQFTVDLIARVSTLDGNLIANTQATDSVRAARLQQIEAEADQLWESLDNDLKILSLQFMPKVKDAFYAIDRYN